MSSITKTIQELNGRAAALRLELRVVTDAIQALQRSCKHKWEVDGTHNGIQHYTCHICGSNREVDI